MRKRIIQVVLVTLVITGCQKETAGDNKTAYIDTEKLMEEYNAAKDIEAKYKEKGKEMGRELEAEIEKFKIEAESYKANAQANGIEWAQKKAAELRQREQQLNMAQQSLMRQLQDESGKELDTLVKQIKGFIKAYGKEKGYDYIYGTGDAATILYAKEKYNITNDILKALNEKYKTEAPKTEATKPKTN